MQIYSPEHNKKFSYDIDLTSGKDCRVSVGKLRNVFSAAMVTWNVTYKDIFNLFMVMLDNRDSTADLEQNWPVRGKDLRHELG